MAARDFDVIWGDDLPPDDNEGLPRCQLCKAVLLNGSAEAWKEKGDVGDWISLEMICSRCAKGKHKSHEPLRCQCTKCCCGAKAVTVLCGFLSCAECEQKHAVILPDPRYGDDDDPLADG